jgi:hypothetical protein
VPLEASVRSDALRERRNVVPISATEDEKLFRAACGWPRRGGVDGTGAGKLDWWNCGGSGRLALGFVLGLPPLLAQAPKKDKDGRREKRLEEDVEDAWCLALETSACSAMPGGRVVASSARGSVLPSPNETCGCLYAHLLPRAALTTMLTSGCASRPASQPDHQTQERARIIDVVWLSSGA